MTKKDYELVARAIRETAIDKKSKQKVVNKLADYFEREQPREQIASRTGRFDRTTFLIDCEAFDKNVSDEDFLLL